MITRHTILCSALLLGLVLPTPAEAPPQDRKIVDFQLFAGTNESFTLTPKAALPLYDTRAARRVLATLPADQPLTVLAMDQFGLQVRGSAKNGPVTGWISQKSVLDDQQRQTLAALFARQTLIEALVARKQAAIGMNFAELTRVLGPATSHNILAEGSGRTETASWVKTQKVDLNDTLDLGTNSSLLKVDVEVGRITVELDQGVARSINLNLEGLAPEIPTIPAPITPPFQRSGPTKLSQTSP